MFLYQWWFYIETNRAEMEKDMQKLFQLDA